MIRRLLTILLMPFRTGCRRQIVEHAHVISPDGRHRLTLRYETRDQRAFDFHDLVLETRTVTGWEMSRTVWCGDAIVPPVRRRWVSELHSVDPNTQTAIIKTGTEGLPDANGVIHVEYAWVRWDLAGNKLLDSLQICEDPFAAFTDTAP